MHGHAEVLVVRSCGSNPDCKTVRVSKEPKLAEELLSHVPVYGDNHRAKRLLPRPKFWCHGIPFDYDRGGRQAKQGGQHAASDDHVEVLHEIVRPQTPYQLSFKTVTPGTAWTACFKPSTSLVKYGAGTAFSPCW